MKYKNNVLFYRFILIFSCAILIPVLTILFATYNSKINESRTLAIYQNNNVLNNVSNTLNFIFGESMGLIVELNLNDKIMVTLKNILNKTQFSYDDYMKIKEITADLDLYTSSRLYLDNVNVLFNNSTGYSLSSFYRKLDTNNHTDTQWYKEWKSNTQSEYFVKPMPLTNSIGNELNPALSICYYTPIGYKIKNSAILVNLKISYLRYIMNNYDNDEYTVSFLTNSGNDIFLGNLEQDGILKKYVESNPLKDATEIFKYENRSYLAAYKELDYFDLRYYVFTSYDEISNQIRMFQVGIVIAVFVSIIISTVLAYFLANMFYKPIRNIVALITDADKRILSSANFHKNNEYSFIAVNLLESYINQHKLEKELADRALQQKESEMLALQAQINPHFLYNTLNLLSLRAFDYLGEENDISRISELLSEILSYSISDPNEKTSLRNEIEYAKNYMQILLYRFEHKFEAQWDIASEVLDTEVPKLILQPLIENAFYHGIQQSNKGSVIRVSCKREGDCVLTKVFDDGAGIDDARLDEIKRNLKSVDKLSYEHIGIYNVNLRIKLKYGDNWGIVLNSEKNVFTEVLLCLPACPAKDLVQ